MRTWGQMFADMAEGGDAGEGGYERACSLSELQAAGRKRVTVQGRIVALFHVSGQVYALDHFCYHAGGPLELGDIEVNSRPPFYCMSPLPYGCVPVTTTLTGPAGQSWSTVCGVSLAQTQHHSGHRGEPLYLHQPCQPQGKEIQLAQRELSKLEATHSLCTHRNLFVA
ncbi:Rieske domain-containing protein, partial [Geodia barretti]